MRSNHGLCPSLGINFSSPLQHGEGKTVESFCSGCSDEKVGGMKLYPTLGTQYPPIRTQTPSPFNQHHTARGKVPSLRTRSDYNYKAPSLHNHQENMHFKNFGADHPFRYSPYSQHPQRRRLHTPTNLKPSLFSRQEAHYPTKSVPSPRFDTHHHPYPHLAKNIPSPQLDPHPYPYSQAPYRAPCPPPPPHPYPCPYPRERPQPQLSPVLLPQFHDKNDDSQCSCSVCTQTRCCSCSFCRKFSVGFFDSNQNCTNHACRQNLRNQSELNFERFYEDRNAYLVQNMRGSNSYSCSWQVSNLDQSLSNNQQQDLCTCACQSCKQVRNAQHAQYVPNVVQTQTSKVVQTQSLSEEGDFYVPEVSLEQDIEFNFEQCASNELTMPKNEGLEKQGDKKDLHEIIDDLLDFDATI